MNYQRLLEHVQDYALTFYKEHDTGNLLYHNQQHTEDVVKATTHIANHYQLSDTDFFIVTAAAWFHDLGYLVEIANHEEQGAALAQTFLTGHQSDMEIIKLVKGCIMATKMPQSPASLLEQIICDADLFHLGTKDFFEKDKSLLKEYNALHDIKLEKLEWRKKSILFVAAHTYFTDYCKVLLSDKQAENVEELKSKVAKEEGKLANYPVPNDGNTVLTNTVTDRPEKKEKKNKDDRPEKGIETMFRISSSNHQRLSDMADKKAHIMITVNSIILSAIISLVLRRLDTYGYLIVPSFILLTVSLTAMTFSILSTRPSIPSGVFSRADVDEKRVNLLFFGNFYKMKLEDFDYGMEKMMQDADFLYGSLIKDLYAQGVVLGRKYHLLRIAYNIFMFGLIVSVVAFIVAFLFFNKGPVPATH